MQKLQSHADGVVRSLNAGAPANLRFVDAHAKQYFGARRECRNGLDVTSFQAEIAEIGKQWRRILVAAKFYSAGTAVSRGLSPAGWQLCHGQILTFLRAHYKSGDRADSTFKGEKD